MSDISKCTGINLHYEPEHPKHMCPIRHKCKRFLVKGNSYKQPYVIVAYEEAEGK